MTAIAQEQSPVLEMRHISKTFVGLRVLKNVSFNVKSGEVHALMGENGAGKSTLMKVLSGAYTADAGGEIRIAGEPVTIDGPLTARRLGVSIIYQELSLAPNLTVAENIFLGSPWSARFLWLNGSWWKSLAPCMPARASSSWTSRQPRFRPARRTSFSI
jgi:ribose transport system ATP-binding protein